MTRALIYTRFSKDDDDEKATARQEKICRAFCLARDWEIVKPVLTDRVSAYTGKDRPGWLAVEQAVRVGTVDAVVVYSISRAARNTVRLLTFAELCKAQGVTFESATEPIGGDFGPVLLAILGALAQLESSVKARRLQDKSAEEVANGTWHGKEPFGYAIVRNRDGHATLQIRPDEADAIRTAARDVLNGKSLKAVAREWNSAGFTTRTGQAWVGNRVGDVLKAPRIAGLREHKGAVAGRAGWEPIVERRTWEKLVAVFEEPSRKARTQGEAYPCTGLLYCKKHGRALSGRPSHGHRDYICLINTPTGETSHLRVRAERVEEYLLRMADETTLRAVEVLDPRDVEAELLARRDELDDRIRAWNREAAKAGLGAAEIMDGRREMVAERDALEEQIAAQAQPTARSWEDLYPGTSDPRTFLQSRIARVDVGPRKDHRRPVDGSLVQLGKRLSITWREGVEGAA